MEYEIQIVTPQSGEITFKHPLGKYVDKKINFTVDSQGHWISDRFEQKATWQDIGEMSIKAAMGIPESACCFNPKHSYLKEVMDAITSGAEKHTEYMKQRTLERFPEVA